MVAGNRTIFTSLIQITMTGGWWVTWLWEETTLQCQLLTTQMIFVKTNKLCLIMVSSYQMRAWQIAMTLKLKMNVRTELELNYTLLGRAGDGWGTIVTIIAGGTGLQIQDILLWSLLWRKIRIVWFVLVAPGCVIVARIWSVLRISDDSNLTQNQFISAAKSQSVIFVLEASIEMDDVYKEMWDCYWELGSNSI